MDLASFNFQGYHLREAFVVESKIVYFGSQDINATLVLEQEEDSEQLKVVREEGGFDLERGDCNTASRVAKTEIYAF